MLLVRGLIAKGRALLWATGGTPGGWGCQVLQTPFLASCPANLLRVQEFFISSVALSVQHRPPRLSAHLLSHLLVFCRVLVATLHPRRCGAFGVSLALPQAVGVQLLLPSAESRPCTSPCRASPLRRRPSCQSLSMSLYFFRRMETWSLNRTGSSLIWECTSGMPPNQLANLFMQVCRWAKWSGSAQRDAREDWWEQRKEEFQINV